MVTDTPRAYFAHLPTQQIRSNPANPRKVFDPTGIDELAVSIAEHGLLQPVIVFKRADGYVLICGERRLRAARKAELAKVPAIVHPVPPEDQEVLSMMLVENLQRRDVDLISESTAIRRLIEEHEWTVTDVSRSLGASAGFVRNRFLLTRFADVLQAYQEERISFSQAIELANVEDDGVRRWFFLRMESGELTDQKALSAAVSRDREIREMLADRSTLERPLLKERIEFEVKGLPYCDTFCPHYRRLSWDEKQEYKVSDRRPGWAEYCAEKCGSCYAQKAKAKTEKLTKLRGLKVKRPIADQDSSSMYWLTLNRLSCSQCKWMVRASDLAEASLVAPDTVHAYCTCPKAGCYNKRLSHVARQQRRALEAAEHATAHTELREQLKKSGQTDSAGANRAQMTKRECVFVLMQLLTYLGGESRLADFSARNGWDKLLPSQRNAKIGFVRNKLLREVAEADVHQQLLDEACLSASYSSERFPPMRFDRVKQSEVAIAKTGA